MATTLVSVVVPVWNGAPFLRECLDSLVAQDHTPIEIIVVDDGSTDESAAVAEEFGHAIVVRQPHRGLGAARNTGIERASGPLVGFCDADDTWLPHKARVQVAYLDEHPDIGIVLCRQETTFEAGVAAPDWLLPDQIRGDLDGIGLASGLCRSGVFTRLDGFRTDMTIGTDFNLLIRARTAGIGIAVIEEQLTTRRIHGDNMTTRDRTAKRALLQSVREHLKAKSR